MRPAALRTGAVCAAVFATAALAAPRQAARAEPRVQAQASSPDAVVLTGRVVGDDGSAPVVRARIVVLAGGRLSDPVHSDDQGRFEIDTPPGGGYELAVSKTGYLRQVVRRPSSRAAPVPIDVRLTRSAVVTGRAVDPAGRPVASIAVQVRRLDGTAIATETQADDRGEFRIGGLAAGRYAVVTLGRPEFAQTAINLTGDLSPDVQDRTRMLNGGSNPSSDAVAIEVRPGSEAEVTVVYREPTVILPYALVGGAITGQVIDESGGPAEGLSVQLWQTRFSGGQPMLQPFGAPRTTDDRGQYRLFHIPAGRYFVVATDESWRTGGGPRFPFLPVYYPGRASHADAATVLVGRSQEVAGIDMAFPRNRGSRIFGSAFDSQGRPLQGRLSLAPTDRVTSAALRPLTAAVSPDGAFEFVNVPPGNYVVRSSPSQATALLAVAADAPNADRQRILALARPPGAPEMESGLQPVVANGGDVGPLVIRTAPTATLSGRVVFQGTRPGAELFAIGAVSADPAFADVAGRQFLAQDTAVAARGGAFELPGLAGPIRLVLTAPAGWWIKSVRIGAIDTALDPVLLTTANDSRDDVTVVVADTAATVGGSVADAQGERADGCYVIVFSTNRDRWFIGSPSVRAVIATNSRFTVASLPPGEYWVAAVDGIEGDSTAGEWQYPELLDSLSSNARRVTLAEGQRMTIPQRITVTAR